MRIARWTRLRVRPFYSPECERVFCSIDRPPVPSAPSVCIVSPDHVEFFVVTLVYFFEVGQCEVWISQFLYQRASMKAVTAIGHPGFGIQMEPCKKKVKSSSKYKLSSSHLVSSFLSRVCSLANQPSSSTRLIQSFKISRLKGKWAPSKDAKTIEKDLKSHPTPCKRWNPWSLWRYHNCIELIRLAHQ